MDTIDPAAIELPPTQPIDMTALLEKTLRADRPLPQPTGVRSA